MGLRAKAREAGAEVKQGLLREAGLQGKPSPEATRPRALSSGSFSPNLLCARLPHKLVRTLRKICGLTGEPGSGRGGANRTPTSEAKLPAVPAEVMEASGMCDAGD